MTSVLVTGATGFIGGQVSRDLLRQGHPVSCCARSAAKIGDARICVVPDIGNSTDWAAALVGVSTIIHTAGRAHVFRDTSQNPIDEFRRINRDGTLNLARAAAREGVKRLVFVSSIGVNGATARRPFNESDAPCPDGPYAVSKLEAEDGLWEIGAQTGMEITVVRPPLVYGPNCRGNFLRLLRLVASGIPLPLASSGNRRNLIGVRNLSDFLIQCGFREEAANQTFLVSDEECISTTELVQLIAQHLARKTRLFRIPTPVLFGIAALVGKQKVVDSLWGNLEVDGRMARARLNWKQPISLDDGIRETCEWFAAAALR